MLPLFYILPTVYCHKDGVTPPLLCLLPTICCLLLLLLADPALSAPEGWAATYGGVEHDLARAIQQTSDGGYIVAGWTQSFDTKGPWVLKLRPDGTVEWQKIYGEGDPNCLQQTRDGGYVVAGEIWSFGAKDFDLWVLKLRPDGIVEWQKSYGGGNTNEARFIQQTREGGYIVAGRTRSFGAGAFDFWVLKLRPDGAVEWQKTYGGDNFEDASSIHETNDGGYIVAGGTKSFGTGDSDIWVLKLGSDGIVEWQKSYGGHNDDWANSIRQTKDGGYVVAGGTKSFGTGDSDIWVLKLRSDGIVEWQKSYGRDNFEVATFIQQTSDGGYIAIGWTWTLVPGSHDLWVLKLRPDGTVEWQKTYGGSKDDWADSVQQTCDSGYIVAGMTVSFGAGGMDFLVLKLMSDGSIGHSCYLTRDTSISEKDSNAPVRDTSISPIESNASPGNVPVIPLDTNALVNILCPSTAVEGLHSNER